MAALDTNHLARLARLKIADDEAEGVQSTLGRIVDMIDAMQAVPTDGVAPMAHPLDATQRLRADQVTEAVDVDVFQANAPETADQYYLVPRVVE